MHIRELAQPDLEPFLPLLGEIEAGSHYDPNNLAHVEWLTKKLRGQIGLGTRFFGLFDGDDTPLGIAGLLTQTTLHTPWTRSELLSIGLFPAHRGKGYGTAFLAAIEQEASKANSYCLYICTYAANHRNISFYGKSGYIPVATMPDTNGPGDEGDVYMRKILVKP